MMTEPPAAHVVTEADNGGVVRLAKGETLVVVLSERPTTGYRWQVAATPACCDVRDDAFEPPATATPGAPGRHTWRLEAMRPGDGVFELKLQPAPGRGGGPAGDFRLRLEGPA